MKGTKTSLFLLELMISLLLFSFCAAICVQIFHASNKRTDSSEALSSAVFHATTAAELYKSVGGDMDALSEHYGFSHSYYNNGVLFVYFDENWNGTLPPMLRASFVSSGYTLSIADNGDSSAAIIITRDVQKYDGNVVMTVVEDVFEITVKAVTP